MSLPLCALVFDFDGTILDTETPEWEGYADLYARHGLDLPLARWQERIGTGDSWDPWTPFLDRPNLTDMRQVHREAFLARLQGLEPREGVVRTLEEARAEGLKLALASSSDGEWVRGHLDRLGLAEFFPVLCVKEDVKKVKPDPALYTLALARLGASADETVAVEDSLNGALAALAAGLRVLLTPNPATETMPFPPEATRATSLAMGLAGVRAALGD